MLVLASIRIWKTKNKTQSEKSKKETVPAQVKYGRNSHLFSQFSHEATVPFFGLGR